MAETKKRLSPKGRKAVKITARICLVAVILFLLFFIVIQAFFPFAAIDVFGFNFYLVSNTGSMEPMLNYNDMIIVKKFDFDKLEEGDIISFTSEVKSGGEVKTIIVTHEIIKIYTDEQTQQKFYRTKGINPNVGADTVEVTADGAGNTNKYIGKYSSKSTFLGNAVAFLKSVPGIIAVILSVAVISGAIFLTSGKSKTKQEETP